MVYRGLKVDPFETTGVVMYFLGRTHEVREENLFLSYVSKRDLVFDIGANLGIYSIIAAKKGAKVISFEPSKSVSKILKRNIT